jgi:tripartite-type tricarboxylate transporter receptor subunit TctC
VPFKATVGALAAVLNGEVDFISYDATCAVTQREPSAPCASSPRPRRKRSSALPEMPTLCELGLGEFDIAPWFGVVVPAGTPRPIVDKLAGWFNQITDSDGREAVPRARGVRRLPRLARVDGGAAQTETERWGRWVKLAKIEPAIEPGS